MSPSIPAGLNSDLQMYQNPPAGSLLGAFRLCAASQHFPPSLPFFGFVLCFLVYKGGFFSSNRVARLSSAYDFGCVVTSCDLLLNESCVFLAFIIRLLTPSIPAGFQAAGIITN